jgi:hypothetical protein
VHHCVYVSLLYPVLLEEWIFKNPARVKEKEEK